MSLSEQQRDDLANLLAGQLGRDNLGSLAIAMGFSELRANLLEPVPAFARRVIDAIDDAQLLNRAVTWVSQGKIDPWFEVQLRSVLAGRRLDDKAKQALRNKYEPFLSVRDTADLLPRVGRTVCAIGITSSGEIVGSGFLIAPDLVMTNFHVMETCIREQDGAFIEGVPGDDIFCFFDYHAPPTPNVPPSDWALRSTACVKAASTRWLVYASRGVTPEGTLAVPDADRQEYDCAVIQLSRPIGKLAVKGAGGRRRGWLSLPAQVDVTKFERRLLVFQHPQQSYQLLDIGDYRRLHPSKTRVWYSVSTAHGSSGGAAVDSDGQLFALHNAAVTQPPAPGDEEGDYNQGIRIDLITQDLRARVPALNQLRGPGDDDDGYAWSLSDDPADPQPIIGRTRFRDLVVEGISSKSERALVVTGPMGSGVRFSGRLLKRVLGPQVPIIEFNASELQRMKPIEFLQAMLYKLGIIAPETAAPPPRETENLARWLRLDLPAWLLARLSEQSEILPEGQQAPARPPAWVVINAVMPVPGGTLLWADHLKDFLAVLAGVKDAGQASVELPQLRWLFLANTQDDLPVRAGKLQDEDLGHYETYQEDFVECLQRAWLTIDKQVIPTRGVLLGMARYVKAQPSSQLLRRALADAARLVVLAATEDQAPDE